MDGNTANPNICPWTHILQCLLFVAEMKAPTTISEDEGDDDVHVCMVVADRKLFGWKPQ